MTELNIEDFFSHHLRRLQQSPVQQDHGPFRSLVSLTLNYNCIWP